MLNFVLHMVWFKRWTIHIGWVTEGFLWRYEDDRVPKNDEL